jgi:hypothetical protein
MGVKILAGNLGKTVAFKGNVPDSDFGPGKGIAKILLIDTHLDVMTDDGGSLGDTNINDIINVTLGNPYADFHGATGTLPYLWGSKALIEWGTGGAEFSAFIDWVAGRVISLSAYNVRVSLIQDLTIPPPFDQYRIGAMAGLGSAQQVQSTYTDDQVLNLGPGVFGPGVSVDIAIPRFGTSILAVNRVKTPAVIPYDPIIPIDIEFTSYGLGLPLGAIQLLGAAQPDRPIPIPNGSRENIRIVNRDVAKTILVPGFNVIFGLTL